MASSIHNVHKSLNPPERAGGILPAGFAANVCGVSNMVFTFTIFSKSINQESRNSPDPSGKSVLSSPSAGGTRPPHDSAQ
jgi:hypothetical protein